LRVVDHAHERPLGGRLRQQAQHGQADQEPIRRRARFQAERGAQGGPRSRRVSSRTVTLLTRTLFAPHVSGTGPAQPGGWDIVMALPVRLWQPSVPSWARAALNPGSERYLAGAFGLRQVRIRPRVSLGTPAWPTAGPRR
jgi:hypothetical protein